MGRFLVGLVVGIAVGAGGLYAFQRLRAADGGVAVAAAGADAGSDGKAPAAGKGKRPRRAATTAAAGADEPAPVLGPEDLKMVASGDALRVGRRTLDLGEGADEPRDLSQAEIDGALAGARGGIEECIGRARGAAELSGRVELGMVVGADGRVTATRVEAPAYLIRRGLPGCVRPKLAALRFPAVGKDTVVTLPVTVN